MIAPIRQTETAKPEVPLTAARRAVAELLLRDPSTRPTSIVSRLVGWLFCGWALAVVVAYFARHGWWNRGS